MWFKNLLTFKVGEDVQIQQDSIAQGLEALRLQPCPSDKMHATGFVSPYPEGHAQLVHILGGAVLLEMAIEQRVLPSDVVRRALRDRIEQHRSCVGRTPGKAKREQLKHEVLQELVPRAFVRQKRVSAYIDCSLGLLVVNTASASTGEVLLKLLQDAIPGFHAVPSKTEESVGGVLTAWLLEGKCADGFQLGTDCQLADPLDTRSQIKASHHELDDSVREHARNGNRVKQLALSFNHRLSFALDEGFVVRKLQFLALVQEELGDITGEDAIAELDARFALMVLELRQLYGAFDAVLKLV